LVVCNCMVLVLLFVEVGEVEECHIVKTGKKPIQTDKVEGNPSLKNKLFTDIWNSLSVKDIEEYKTCCFRVSHLKR
jgi:hypothetical protein